MSETVKLIIEIPKDKYERCKDLWFYDTETLEGAVAKGIPLDDIKAEIEKNAYPIVHGVNNHEKGMTLYGILQVLDNIGKGDKE